MGADCSRSILIGSMANGLSGGVGRMNKKQLTRELREEQRNSQITKLLTGQRCPASKQVIKLLKGVHI